MNAVIIFTKFPRKGIVKTRLGKTLGNKFAVDFSRLMAEHVFNVCLSLPENDYHLFLFHDNPNEKDSIKNWVDKRFSLQLQEGADLGEKMKNAFRFLFNKGYKKIVITGTDCPDIEADILLKAFAELSSGNAAIGPSTDGGYYLLGMDSFYPFLFDDIKWSSDTVFQETIKRLKENRIDYSFLPVLIDIDTEEDLKKWLMNSKKENEMTKLIDLYGLR
jgi:rSAM/selenodomain-associated transferase 1